MTTFILINYFVDAYPDLKRLEKEILDEVNLNESNRSMFIFSEYSLPVTLGCLFLMGFFGMQVQESPYAEVSSFICFFTCAFTNHNFINFCESVFAHRDLRLAREKNNEDTPFYI